MNPELIAAEIVDKLPELARDSKLNAHEFIAGKLRAAMTEGWSPAYAEVLKLRREHDRLIRELRDTREHWLTIAKDYRTRANEWASGNVMHTMRLAEAKTLENCAYALAVALQANVRMSDGL